MLTNEQALVLILERFMQQWPHSVSQGLFEAALITVQRAKTGKPNVSPARWAEILKDAGI